MGCPNCNYQVEFVPGECEICPECGAELQAAAQCDNAPESAASSAADYAGELRSKEENIREEVFADFDFASVFARMAASSSGISDNWDLSSRSQAMADWQGNDEKTDFYQRSECRYLQVEYNRNLFFLSGSEAVMKLRITPRSPELENMLLFMETQRSGSNIRRQIPVREILQPGRPFYLHVPYHPQQISGRVAFTFYVGCQTACSLEYYQFSVEHKVYDPNQTTNSLKSQVIINTSYNATGNATIDTSVKASGAGEINYRNTVADALKQLGNDPSVHELIDRLNDLPPEYESQVLTTTTWRPEEVLIKGNLYNTDRLILEWNNITIYVISAPCVKFGRDSEKSDLLVRCGMGSLSPREYPNSTVSRLHAELLYCEDTVKLFDRSSYGTYINGRKPDSVGIPMQDNAKIEFGDIHWQMNIQHCMQRSNSNICQTCLANKIKSLTFTRTDQEPEYYLLVWQCCELGRVIEELSDWNIFFRNNSFFIRTPDQEFFHLRPGQTIESNNQQIKVKYFNQK